MPQTTDLFVWSSDGSSNNPFITCTRSCLSSKNGMNFAPTMLPECTLTSISADTQTALCAIIAATNVASIAGYASWQCGPVSHAVVTQPCNGTTTLWLGITGCNSIGEVTSISLSGIGLTGNYYCRLCFFCLLRTSTALCRFNSFADRVSENNDVTRSQQQ